MGVLQIKYFKIQKNAEKETVIAVHFKAKKRESFKKATRVNKFECVLSERSTT